MARHVLLRKLGIALTLVCVAIVLWRLAKTGSELGTYLVGREVLPAALALTLCYAAALFLPAASWATLSRANSKSADVGITMLIRAYGISSIAKYLPGNVFHLVGRQWLSSRHGIAHGALAFASILEIVLCLLTAALLASVLALLSPAFLPAAALIAAKAVLALLVMLFVLFQWQGMRAWLQSGINRIAGSLSVTLPPPGPFVRAATLCCLFFALCAAIAVGSFATLEPLAGLAPYIGTAFLIAWIAGYAVPGAPGGIGVREAVLVALLAPVMTESAALAVALLTRFITSSGDLLFFAVSHLLANDSRKTTQNTIGDRQ